MNLKRLLSLAVTSAAIGLGASAAQAAVIIDGSTQGYYNAGLGNIIPVVGDPLVTPIAPEPNLGSVANLGTWLTNAAPSGGTWSATPVAIPSTWTVGDETAIVYAINAGSGLSNVHIDLGVDNGIYVWLNGAYIFGAMAPGGAALSEYDIVIGSLSAGMHYLQILREDHGGATGYLIEMTADRSQVPAPGALALLGIGLAGLGLSRRRTR
jgi:hypothetical protein